MKKTTTHVYYINREITSLVIYLNEIRKLNPSQKLKNGQIDERKAEIAQKQEEYELWLQMRKGNMKAREKLINNNLLYVVSVAKKYLWSGAALEDLIMAGNLGLVKAADRFDASLGCKFISYATWYIECEVKKALNDYLLNGKTSSNSDYDDVELLEARPSYYSDWDARYHSTLDALKQSLNKRLYNGAGQLLTDYLAMMQSGLTTTDFKRKHHFSDGQMEYFLETVRSLMSPLANTLKNCSPRGS